MKVSSMTLSALVASLALGTAAAADNERTMEEMVVKAERPASFVMTNSEIERAVAVSPNAIEIDYSQLEIAAPRLEGTANRSANSRYAASSLAARVSSQ